MSIIPSQTNINKDNYFFSLAGAGGGGVQTITAGSNVSVSGTSNVTINAVGTVATITAGSNVSVSGTSNVTINAVGTVATITAGSNVTVSGTSNVTINATVPITALTAGSNITLSGTSNVTINATTSAQGVVSINKALDATGSNAAQINTGLAGDLFGINTGAYAIGGNAYLMTATAQITSATFATTPDGFVRFCASVGSITANTPFIYFPFPKLIANVGAAVDDNIITVSGVFVAGSPVTIGIDNRTGANLGAGDITITLTNISFVGLGNNVNTIANWL